MQDKSQCVWVQVLLWPIASLSPVQRRFIVLRAFRGLAFLVRLEEGFQIGAPSGDLCQLRHL